MLGHRAVVVLRHLRFQGGQALARGQGSPPAPVSLGGHAPALALAAHHVAHKAFAHPEAGGDHALAALATLPRAKYPLAQVQRIRSCHPPSLPISLGKLKRETL